MAVHLPDSVVETLADLDHNLVETEGQIVLMVKVRSRDARKIREKLKTQLSRAHLRAIVVLSSSASQGLDISKWRPTEPTATRAVKALRLGSYLLT